VYAISIDVDRGDDAWAMPEDRVAARVCVDTRSRVGDLLDRVVLVETVVQNASTFTWEVTELA
jgi:hypothetical protein